MPYTNEDALYNEIELLNQKIRILQTEINIIRKQIMKSSVVTGEKKLE